MKTAGLPENIRETIPIGIDPVAAGLQNVQDGATFFRTMDLDAVQYGLNIESTFEVIGPRNITITEIEFDTILMVERNVAHSLNWTFQNRYWILHGITQMASVHQHWSYRNHQAYAGHRENLGKIFC